MKRKCEDNKEGVDKKKRMNEDDEDTLRWEKYLKNRTKGDEDGYGEPRWTKLFKVKSSCFENPNALYERTARFYISPMEQLLIGGANPNCVTNGDTPLKKAIRHLLRLFKVEWDSCLDDVEPFASIERQIVLLLAYGADDSIIFSDKKEPRTCREIIFENEGHDLYEKAEVEKTMRKIRSIQDMEEVLNCVVNEDKPKPFFDNFLGDCSDNVLDWERVFGERICPFLFEYNRK
jgi:hypothetical protein